MSFHSAKFDFQHYVLHYLHLIYREEGKRNISKVYLIRQKKDTHKFVYILIMVVSKKMVILLVMN
jgi:hypothetical protein